MYVCSSGAWSYDSLLLMVMHTLERKKMRQSIHICIHTVTYLFVLRFIYVHTYIRTHAYTHFEIHVRKKHVHESLHHVCMPVYVYVRLCMCACFFLYVYVHNNLRPLYSQVYLYMPVLIVSVFPCLCTHTRCIHTKSLLRHNRFFSI
jgi:hypothetical protein